MDPVGCCVINGKNAALSASIITTQVGLAAGQAVSLWRYKKLVLGFGELTELQGDSPKQGHQFFTLQTFNGT